MDTFLHNTISIGSSNKSRIKLSSPLQRDSVVDGPGLRTVIWTQGCVHNCPGCHNPETHSFIGGFYENVDSICKNIKMWRQNITFSGGDPMLQAKQCARIANYAKTLGLTAWAYTGYSIEYLLENFNNNGAIRSILDNIDRLVDGKFDISKKSMDCSFRGSTNQRIIDVPKTLANFESGLPSYVVIDNSYDLDIQGE